MSEVAGVGKCRSLSEERERLAMILGDSDDEGERQELCARIAVLDVALLSFPQRRIQRRSPHIPIG